MCAWCVCARVCVVKEVLLNSTDKFSLSSFCFYFIDFSRDKIVDGYSEDHVLFCLCSRIFGHLNRDQELDNISVVANIFLGKSSQLSECGNFYINSKRPLRQKKIFTLEYFSSHYIQ